MQIALARGAKVYVATRGNSHRDLALKMGAHWVGDTFDKIPCLLDHAILFAPLGEIVPHALKSLNKGGTLALAGIHMSPVPAMSYEECLFHEKNRKSVEANTREDGRELLEQAAKIGLKPKITLFDLEQANEALIKLKTGGIDGTGVLRIP